MRSTRTVRTDARGRERECWLRGAEGGPSRGPSLQDKPSPATRRAPNSSMAFSVATRQAEPGHTSSCRPRAARSSWTNSPSNQLAKPGRAIVRPARL